MIRKRRRQKTKRRIRPELLIICVFVFSFLFYIGAVIGLNSYNLTLSKEEQQLNYDIDSKKAEIEELETEVRSMQEKKSMLGSLSLNMQDNQSNIYIMGNGEED